ncbi:hypothetical protein D9757_004984 [Collybiopsis confluens]|uniref:Uncharacterized protein n=1 Tax=Collybiopsis confluens TaxID=2823264 RepID=A0A8H5MCP3_9AGAR|nr:hypothetical protein D9757_004984 [Collybiopsis confluens]
MLFKTRIVFAAMCSVSTLVHALGVNTTGELEKRAALSFNPKVEDIRKTAVQRYPQELGSTNAERFKMGLPPMRPRFPTPSQDAPRGEPSGRPGKMITGSLHIHDAANGKSLGYVSNTLNSFGEYGLLTMSSRRRLKVKVDTTNSEGPLNIATLNGPDADFPFLVGIDGYANDVSDGLNVGKYNYAYLGAGSRTALGSCPVLGAQNSFTKDTGIKEGIESMIFVLEPAMLNLLPRWINEDGSKPTTYLGLFKDTLFFTGDKDVFEEVFEDTPTWVKILLEPDFS